jgi:hypothetical protein
MRWLSLMWLSLMPLVIASTPAPCETGERACDPRIVSLFSAARTHDVRAILQQGPTIARSRVYERPDWELQQSYELALYVADPRRFATRYVRAFKASGSINDLFARLAERGLLPGPDTPFTIILQRARLGDSWAMRDVLVSTVVPVNDFIPAGFEGAASDIEMNPPRFLIALRTMTSDERLSLICTSAGTSREHYQDYARRLLHGIRPQSPADRSMLRQIIALKNCAPYDVNF